MNLRALAEKDLAFTLEGTETGGASEFTLFDKSGSAYPLRGTVGDIGYLLDGEGNAIQGRQIVNTFRMSTLAAQTAEPPAKGNKIVQKDLSGTEWTLFVVRYEPDRTIGIGRLVLALDLSK
jgi:hypothetical protein